MLPCAPSTTLANLQAFCLSERGSKVGRITWILNYYSAYYFVPYLIFVHSFSLHELVVLMSNPNPCLTECVPRVLVTVRTYGSLSDSFLCFQI